MSYPKESFRRELADRYELQQELGRGGMGIVYKAHDRKHDRAVAIKTVRADLTTDSVKRRFEREISITAHLQHPHVLPLLDSGVAGGVLYYVMPFVEGESLDDRLQREGTLPKDEAIAIARDVAKGLHHAHEQGIVHRDVKPGNILLTSSYALIADFGIGKAIVDTGAEELTKVDAMVGSLHYMAPEQLEGVASPQSDVYALGAVLYKALTGRNWLTAVTKGDAAWEGVSAPLRSALKGALAPVPSERWQDVQIFADELGKTRVPLTVRGQSWKRIAVAGVLLTAATAGLSWSAFHTAGVRWATDVAIPQIEELIALERYEQAARLAEDAERYVGRDSAFRALWPQMTAPVTITSDSEDALVYVSAVQGPTVLAEAQISAPDVWLDVGTPPIELDRLPLGVYRVRALASGSDTLETLYSNPVELGEGAREWHVTLSPSGAVPAGMARIRAQTLTANLHGLEPDFRPAESPPTDDAYLLGKYEVTNGEYKEFVDAGAYRDSAFWTQDFTIAGETVSWEAAMTRLVDRSGRHGPSTWDAGTYPEGQADFPVSGISWYEAAAYAEFAGAQLPTLFHWQGATEYPDLDMAGFGNYRGTGATAVGASAFGPHGLYDLAGNVREWVWNATESERYILGGGWSDPHYMYLQGGVAPPFDRSPQNGVRLARFPESSPNALATLRAPIEREISTFVWGADPVEDEVYAALLARYEYDAKDLEASVDIIVDDSPVLTKETVSFTTAYDDDRVLAHLFIPKNVAPPYQTVVVFPGVGAMRPTSSERLEAAEMVEEVVKSGRAVLYPIYKDTYERFIGEGQNRGVTREYVARKARWVQDARRAVDYLETRPDIDHASLVYWGFSWGAEHGPIILASEPRFAAALLMDGGANFVPVLPAADESNFAPRVRVPILMINGRYDYIFPVESTQRPFFELLGTPDSDKRHVLFESGHVAAVRFFREVMDEVVGWLDEYFGRVQ